MRWSSLLIVVASVASAILPDAAGAQDCSALVNAALADGSLNVVSVTPEGVRIGLAGRFASEADPGKLRALLDNVECAVAGPGGQLKNLELLSPDQQVIARKAAGTIELPQRTTP